MKARVAAAAAVAAAGAYAQSVSYTTVTYDDCSSMPMETMITVTNGVTVTYCPECEMMSSVSPHQPGHTTTYTTTYMSLCPTGMVPATYTVTESCTEPTPTWTPGPSHIPQGFTVTEKVCHVCDKTPTTVTITEPCGCDANEGVPATNNNPAPTGSGGSPPGGSSPGGSSPGGSNPGGNSPGGSPATPTGSSSCDGKDCGGSSSQTPPCDGQGCGGSGSPSPPCDGQDCGGSGSPSPPCDGQDCGGSSSGGSPPGGSTPGKTPPGSSPGSGPGAPPYPTPTTTAESCPGPQCRARATGSAPSGVDYGNTTGIVPAEGSASLAVLSSTIMAVVVAALAFAL